jgi:hypothetical protein
MDFFWMGKKGYYLAGEAQRRLMTNEKMGSVPLCLHFAKRKVRMIYCSMCNKIADWTPSGM